MFCPRSHKGHGVRHWSKLNERNLTYLGHHDLAISLFSKASPMSIERLLKKIRSKKNVSEVHFGASVPEDDKCVLRTTATTSDCAVPYHPDPLKGVWTADYRDLPRAQGTENFLNSIGGWIIPFPLILSLWYISYPKLIYHGKGMSGVLQRFHQGNLQRSIHQLCLRRV